MIVLATIIALWIGINFIVDEEIKKRKRARRRRTPRPQKCIYNFCIDDDCYDKKSA